MSIRLLSSLDRAPRRPALVYALDDAALVAGVGVFFVSLRGLALPAHPLGLLVLTVLALSVRAYPLMRGRHGDQRAGVLSFTACSPLLAVLALYGTAWMIAVAASTVALDGLARARLRLALESWARGVARAALSAALAGLVFSAADSGPATAQQGIALVLPALLYAEVSLALASLLLSAPAHAIESAIPIGRLLRESALGSLPALAAEPVLAYVLLNTARNPAPATLLAAVAPLAGLIAALRLHTDLRGKLVRTNSALRHAHEQLRIQATTDPLTGLANRRLFEEMLGTRLAEAARYGRPLAVLMLDLDGFKRINDTYGHAAGDAVLIAVAGALRRGLRRTDVPARLAGDEFVALLPETNGQRALALAERVCNEVAKLEVAAGSEVIRPSASVGAASTDGNAALDPAGLLAAADGAAYTAKAAGKNAARLAVRNGLHPAGHGDSRRLPARQRARGRPVA